MQIILKGTKEETQKWTHALEKLTDRKICYTAVRNDKGESTVVIDLGTKEDYPQQRIVRKRIEEEEYPVFRKSEEISQ